MVVEVLTANSIAVGIRIVSPAEDSRMREVIREEISEPMFAVRGRPSLVLVSVEAVDCNNTRINSQSSVVH